jgi:hypothetical protein
MGRGERAADLHRDSNARRRIEYPPACDLVREIAALEKLHRQVKAAIVELTEVEHVEHVRVLDARRADRFLLKARDDLALAGVFRAQHLERDALLDRHVLRQINFPHAALAEGLDDAVAPRNEGSNQRIVRVSHGGDELAQR